MQKGDVTGIATYQRADRVRARSRRAYYNLALAYKRKDDLDAAVETLRKLITMQPDFADAHFTLGEIYVRQGKFDEAKPELGERQVEAR